MNILQGFLFFVSLFSPLHAENVLAIRSLEKSWDGCTPLLTVCFDGQTVTSNSTYCELEIRNNSSSLTEGLTSYAPGRCQTFEVDIASFSGKTVFILTLFEANYGKGSKVQAHGNVTVTLRNISFHSNWIGSKSVGYYGRAIRIQHNYVATMKERLEANLVGSKNSQSSSCIASPCFLMEIKNARQCNQVQFCVWNMAPSDTNGVKVCEKKLPGNFVGKTIPELPKPNPIELRFHGNDWKPYVFITGAFDNSTEYIEVVLFKIGGGIQHFMTAKCQHMLGGQAKSCKVKATSQLHGQYQVLLTALDKQGRVTHSSTSQLENYGTKLRQMTPDLIEVQWRVFENGIYEIYLDMEVPGSYSSLRVPCGFANNHICTAYFIKLVPNTYSVSVVMVGKGMKSVVARSIAITADKEEHLKVYSLVTNTTDQQKHVENLTVCVEDTIDSNKFDLVLIDQWGSTVKSGGMLQGKKVLCFPSVTLHPNFDTSGRIRILVIAEVMYNFFYGDTELYLLDLNHLKPKPLLRAHQVSRRIVRVKWLNLNDGEVVIKQLITLPSSTSMPSTSVIKCKYMEECGTYLYFTSKDASFQITEVGETIQIVNVKMILTDIPTIGMIKSTIVMEGQVEVCLSKVSNASRYEMGLQVKSKLLEDIREPSVIPHGTKQLCLTSRNTLEVGPAAVISIVISAFESRGSLIGGTNDILPVNFISSSKSLIAVSALDGIIASWQHLEDVNDNNDYKVTLEALGASNIKVIEEVETTQEAFLHMFLWNGVGDLAVCLSASREIPNIVNGRTCSDVVHTNRTKALKIPMVKNMKLRSRPPESILVSWDAPKDSDVSNYVILWNLDITDDIDHHVREEDAVYSLSPVVGGQRFILVPASKTSYILNGLDENNKYLVCVSAVVSNIMGRKHCLEAKVDSAKSLTYPLDVEYKDGSVQWSGNYSSHCMVEWELQGTGGRAEVQGNSFDLTLSPGVWGIQVNNITNSATSGPTKIQASVSGITISSKQTNQTSVRVTWSENNGIPNMMGFGDSYTYNITLRRNGSPLWNPQTRNCSGRRDDCCVEFGSIYASPKDKLSVEVYSHCTKSKGEIHIQMLNVQNVTALKMKMSGFKKAKVTWSKVAEARQYKYILYSTMQKQPKIRLVGTQPENVLQLNMPDLVGCVVCVQVCIAENVCGDIQSITLELHNEHSVAVIFGLSVLVTAVFLVVIFFTFRQNKAAKQAQTDRQKILEEEATSTSYYVNGGFDS